MQDQDNSPHAVSEAERSYAKKLAQVYVRLAQMTPQEREPYANKVRELTARLSKLPPAVREVYDDEVRALSGPAKKETKAAPGGDRPATKTDRRMAEAAPVDDEEDEDEDEAPKKHRGCIGCLVVLLLLAAIVAAAGLFAWNWVQSEIGGKRGDEVTESTFIVERGSGTSTIGNQLESNGIIRNAMVFRLYVRQTEQDGTLQYGE